MRLWEKNYLYTLALFTLLFYICIFIVITTSFSAALSSERDAALREEGFISQSLQSDISYIHAGDAAGRAAVSRFSTYSSYYKKRGISLALYRGTALLQGEAPVSADVAESGRICDIITSGGLKYIRVSDTPIAGEYSLIYAKDISAAYASLERQSALLISVSAAASLVFALLLFFTLKRIYRPVGSLAHELRTPLTVIRGYAEYLETAAANEEDRYTATKYIVDESRRLSEVCEKLLIMANLHEGDIAFENVDIAELFENAKMTYGGVEYETHTQYVKANKPLLQSMVNNLVSNAKKASAPGDIVRLSAYSSIIEVSDTGKGMNAAFLSRISKHGGRPDSEKNIGGGLGLPLCFQIARLHGAQLVFESAPGEGTTVRIIFTPR